MKVKAKKTFPKNIGNAYHGLEPDQYYQLAEGKTIELKKVPAAIKNHITKG